MPINPSAKKIKGGLVKNLIFNRIDQCVTRLKQNKHHIGTLHQRKVCQLYQGTNTHKFVCCCDGGVGVNKYMT